MLVNENNNPWYYKIAYFFIANQVVFKRLLVVLLILLNIILWWSSGVKIVNYLANSSKYNQSLISLTENQIDWENYHLKNKPQDLEIISVNKIKIDQNKYDLLAEIYNPNTDWQIEEITYAFIVDNYILDWQTDFVLPGQNKYLFKFSYFSTNPLSEIDLKIDDINWQRVKDKSKIELLDSILIQNENFSTTGDIAQLEFEVTNNSPYSFWQTGWQIILYQGSRPVAINYVTSNNFFSGETKNIVASWSESVTRPTKTEVLPDINIFDENNYITDLEIPPVNLIKGASDER